MSSADNSDKISLIIFDCDGVLVDSEMLSASTLQAMMAEIGMSLSDAMFKDVFLGRSYANAKSRAKEILNFELPDNFEARYRERLFGVLTERLRAMMGVVEVLNALRLPYCVATGSSPKRLALSLEVTGLSKFFNVNKFTVSEVANSKPAPDLYFYAAEKMKVPPSECLVIEDSEAGVMAATAAGMRVWHFAGGAHIKAGYHLPDHLTVAKSFADMPSLRRALVDLGACDA